MHHTIIQNYQYELPAQQLLQQIKHIAKSSFQMVGTTLEKAAAAVTFLADGSTISFHLASERHLTVRIPSSRHGEAMKICKRLVGSKTIAPVYEKTSRPCKTEGSFRKAGEVLEEFLARPEVAEHIVVLAEASEESGECAFTYDTVLVRHLEGLLAFAKLKADPANALKPDDHLATEAGLGHFGADLGEHAKIRYATDYTAVYKGVARLFPLHVTLGSGLNPRSCMSIYFDWDPEPRKLILARFGRHGRGA